MSHSIVNYNECRVELLFKEDQEVVKLIIVSEDVAKPIDNDNSGLPEYVSNIVNVPVVDDKSKLKRYSQHPIVIYIGSDKSLPHILLLEETRYYFKVDKPVKKAFTFLSGQTKDKLFFQNVRLEGNLYTLYSKSFVGKGNIDITIEENEEIIPFEIRSKKIEYLDQYPQMLRDIAVCSTSLLLDSKTPLYRNFYTTSGTSSSKYENFLILEYIFDKMDFEEQYEYIRNNLNTELIKHIEPAPIVCASVIDVSSLPSLICGSNLTRCENGVLCGQYNPKEIMSVHYEDSYNTVENRLVKELLLIMQSMLYAMNVLLADSDYLLYRIKEMKNIIDSFIQDSWLADVGEMTIIPFNSTIIQSKHGYSTMFEIYNMLGMNISLHQNDLAYVLNGHGKKVYDLYEYWCYIKIHECLQQMSVNKPELSDVVGKDDKVLLAREGKPIVYEIRLKKHPCKVYLYYNKTFKSEKTNFKSYSIMLRPDFTLVVSYLDQHYILNFDSKYKLKIKSKINVDDDKLEIGCWEFDIYKMHTYRDALMRSLGSYVLYPGNSDNKKWKIYVKPFKTTWDEREGNDLPSVGAISLTPGSHSNQQLKLAL